MAGGPVVHVYLVLVTQGPERHYVEVEAPDIETAASLGGGIVIAMRDTRRMPPIAGS